MSANHGWRMSLSSTPTIRDCRSTSLRAAAFGRYPTSATAFSTASRLAALTRGESRNTSETSERDTPARAATVSSVGRGARADVTAPSRRPCRVERSNAMSVPKRPGAPALINARRTSA